MFGEPRNPIEKQIGELEAMLLETQKKIQDLRSQLPEEKIQNYSLKTLDDKSVQLLDLFGDHDELLLIHNMGPQCSYCTLWADGFRGMRAYYESRCAFVLEMDRAANELKNFKQQRQWDFEVVSSYGSSLKKDLGFQNQEGSNWPGVSSLFRRDGEIYRHATAPFGPGDAFCPPWHFFNLLKNGVKNWEPKYNL